MMTGSAMKSPFRRAVDWTPIPSFMKTHLQSQRTPSSFFSHSFVSQSMLKSRTSSKAPRLKRSFQACASPDRFSKNTESKKSIGNRDFSDIPAYYSSENMGQSEDTLTFNQEFYPKDRTEWSDWLKYISQIETVTKQLQTLTDDMDTHAKWERFAKAAKCQAKIDLCEEYDMILRLDERLEDAIVEEDFEKAAKLRDEGLVGLSGWWIARGKDDPKGTLVCIHQGFSHYVGRAFNISDVALANDKHESELLMSLFSDRQDAAYTLSTLVLEVYLKEDNNGGVSHQTCISRTPFLPRPDSPSRASKEQDSTQEAEKKRAFDIEYQFNEEGNAEMVTLTERDSSGESNQDEGEDGDGQGEKYLAMELQFRVPGEIRWWDRNRFLLTTKEEPEFDFSDGENARIEAIERIMAQRSFWSVMDEGACSDSTTTSFDQSFSQVLDRVLDEVHAQSLRNEEQNMEDYDPYFDYGYYDPTAAKDFIQLEGETMFSRLPDEPITNDLFTGFYIGKFGPHGLELLHLSRQIEKDTGREFVEAEKVTGDPNVPSGEVTFWAYIGPEAKTSFVGRYPEEYEIQSVYSGKGRVAGAGFQDPKWVDGDLLVFEDWSSLTGRSELGFVWAVPNARKFLILLSRVMLPDY